MSARQNSAGSTRGSGDPPSVIDFQLGRIWIAGSLDFEKAPDLVKLRGELELTVAGKPVPGVRDGDGVSIDEWLRQLHGLLYPPLRVRDLTVGNHEAAMEVVVIMRGDQPFLRVMGMRGPVPDFKATALDPTQLIDMVVRFELRLKELLLGLTTTDRAASWWSARTYSPIEEAGTSRHPRPGAENRKSKRAAPRFRPSKIKLTDDGQPLELLLAIDQGKPLDGFPRPLLVCCIADAGVSGRPEAIDTEELAEDFRRAFNLIKSGGLEDVVFLHEVDPLEELGFFDDFPDRALVREIKDPFLRWLGGQTSMRVITEDQTTEELRDKQGRSLWRPLIGWEAEPPLSGFSFSILRKVLRAPRKGP